jgi:hypothetical protein
MTKFPSRKQNALHQRTEMQHIPDLNIADIMLASRVKFAAHQKGELCLCISQNAQAEGYRSES